MWEAQKVVTVSQVIQKMALPCKWEFLSWERTVAPICHRHPFSWDVFVPDFFEINLEVSKGYFSDKIHLGGYQ
jgi:hypothetical protein